MYYHFKGTVWWKIKFLQNEYEYKSLGGYRYVFRISEVYHINEEISHSKCHFSLSLALVQEKGKKVIDSRKDENNKKKELKTEIRIRHLASYYILIHPFQKVKKNLNIST